ncbi:MAG: nuclear transport factor 2 family protein [Actinomycetota bacterium]
MTLTIDEWLEGYRRAWEEADDDAVVELFTEDAEYLSYIYDEPHRGRDGVRAYWQGVTSTQSNVAVRMGRPIVDGDRVAAEWWTTMENDGSPVTLSGCLLGEFDAAGLCRRLREYWNLADGAHVPPPVWGT